MKSNQDEGKWGFLMALISMIVLVFSFATTALGSGSPTLNKVIIIAVFAGLSGHFVLGGAEYRAQIIAKKRKAREEAKKES